ncbi:MAG TPA: nucleotide sugar dehydrogenase [Longimicrobiales bacterium]|nr:nucleotide sugar dehydrogenase [Longimicrobiales bacterium]
MSDRLLECIENQTAVCGIIGLGYVGLPLAVEVGRAGYRVLGYDVSERTVAGLNAGESHIKDVESAAIQELIDASRFEASTDASRLAGCDIVVICVPTPLGKTRDPDVSYVVAATEAVAAALRPGQLVILESTTYPGTTRELMLPVLQAGGLEVGADFFLCFSPERVDPGNERWVIRNTPKVIGGITPACLEHALAFYGRVMQTVVPVSSTETAELTKLLENTFRAVNIALVNEMAQVCDRLDVDVFEVIEAAATKPFGFMKFTPGPGIGGHCIPLDPHYLAWKMKTLNYRTRMIDLAGEVNSEMPRFVVEKVRDALNDVGRALKGSRVLVLGVAYKRDIDDVRESPALDIMRLLEEKGAEVVYHDPYVPQLIEDGHARESVAFDAAELAAADCILIATDHASVDYERLIGLPVPVVDSRNAMRGLQSENVVGLSGQNRGGPLETLMAGARARQ